MAAASLKQILGNKRIGMMLPLGFASGLPLALTAGTLQAWLAVVGVDLKTIGIFTLVGLPYTLKFLWAPLMDRIVPPWLGRRRGGGVGFCHDPLTLPVAGSRKSLGGRRPHPGRDVVFLRPVALPCL